MAQALLSLSSLAFAITFFFFGFDLLKATTILFWFSLGSLALLTVRPKGVKKSEWGALLATLLLSGLAIFFKEKGFILWRPTIVNSAIGIGLFVLYRMKKAPFEYLFGKLVEIELPQKEWLKVNIIWGTFMFLCALINAVVVLLVTYLNLDEKVWVITKVAVMPILTLIFTTFVLRYLMKQSRSLPAVDTNRDDEKELKND